YADKLGPEERHLQPSRPAAELERVIRALTPHVGAYLELAGGGRLGVRAARVLPDGPAPGALEARGEQLLLGSGDGALRLDRAQPRGKRPMRAADSPRGHAPPSKAL